MKEDLDRLADVARKAADAAMLEAIALDQFSGDRRDFISRAIVVAVLKEIRELSADDEATSQDCDGSVFWRTKIDSLLDETPEWQKELGYHGPRDRDRQ